MRCFRVQSLFLLLNEMLTSVLTHLLYSSSFLFFFNDTATTEIYTLSLHDALPISTPWSACSPHRPPSGIWPPSDRKSTRLNSSHANISYAVFCLKRKSTRLNSSHANISYAVFCLNKTQDRLTPALSIARVALTALL